MARLTTEKLLAAGFIAALALLGVVGYIALRGERINEERHDWVEHTRLVRGEVARLQSRLERLESAGRLYMLTGDEADLTDLPALFADISRRQQRLRELTRDNPEQQHHLDEISRLIPARAGLLNARIRLRRESGLEAVAAAIRSHIAKRLMQVIREELGQMDAIEEKLLSERVATTRDSGRAAVAFIAAITVLGMAGVGLVGWRVFRDLRERRRLETKLADFKAALDEHAIVAITDARGKITYVNDKFCAIAGYAREELLGQDHRLINSGHHAKAFIRELWETITSGQVWNGELKNRAKDGTIYWVDTTIVPFLDKQGKPAQFIAIRTDITRRKQAEEQIIQLNDELRQHSLQIEAANHELEAFSYSVSHDLRAPLRHIDGFINLMQKETAGALNEKTRHYQEVIAQSAQRMGRLIDDLLGFARIGRVELQPGRVELRSLMELARSEQTEAAGGRVIDWRIGELPAVLGDSALLMQVARNLLSNAVKFTAGRDSTRIEISALPPENGLAGFVVRDNGAGFDEKYAGKLFEVFQRLHPREKFEGTGVGLATVRRIITRLGGTIHATAGVNEGAAFFIRLPAAAAEEEEEEGYFHDP